MKLRDICESKTDVAKTYFMKMLFNDWQHDDLFPIDVDSIDDMKSDDYDMFFDQIKEIVKFHKAHLKLSPEQAYAAYDKLETEKYDKQREQFYKDTGAKRIYQS